MCSLKFWSTRNEITRPAPLPEHGPSTPLC
jgi:hypothetical protein